MDASPRPKYIPHRHSFVSFDDLLEERIQKVPEETAQMYDIVLQYCKYFSEQNHDFKKLVHPDGKGHLGSAVVFETNDSEEQINRVHTLIKDFHVKIDKVVCDGSLEKGQLFFLTTITGEWADEVSGVPIPKGYKIKHSSGAACVIQGGKIIDMAMLQEVGTHDPISAQAIAYSVSHSLGETK